MCINQGIICIINSPNTTKHIVFKHRFKISVTEIPSTTAPTVDDTPIQEVKDSLVLVVDQPNEKSGSCVIENVSSPWIKSIDALKCTADTISVSFLYYWYTHKTTILGRCLY